MLRLISPSQGNENYLFLSGYTNLRLPFAIIIRKVLLDLCVLYTKQLKLTKHLRSLKKADDEALIFLCKHLNVKYDTFIATCSLYGRNNDCPQS